MTKSRQGAEAVRLIKKYANRRLYDTAISACITLADVKQLILENVEFTVQDSKTHEDVTRSILLQIVLEEEAGGAPLFSDATLKHFILIYGKTTQGHFGKFMEKSLQTFTEAQQLIQEQTRQMMEYNPMLNPELMAKLLTGQANGLPDAMGNYLAQSAQTFMDMQQKLQQQAQQLFGMMPGNETRRLTPEKAPDDADDKKK